MLKKYPLILVALRNGALGGALGFTLLVVLYFLGRHPFLIPVYVDFRIVLFAVMIFFSQKELRDYYQGGVIYFWQGMALSLFFTAVFSGVASLLIDAFATLRPEFVRSYITLALEQLRMLPPELIKQVGKDFYDSELVLVPKTTAGDLAIRYFWQSFVISFFLSTIISVILRRQPKP